MYGFIAYLVFYILVLIPSLPLYCLSNVSLLFLVLKLRFVDAYGIRRGNSSTITCSSACAEFGNSRSVETKVGFYSGMPKKG